MTAARLRPAARHRVVLALSLLAAVGCVAVAPADAAASTRGPAYTVASTVGHLPQPSSPRRYGLPAALAVVALLGSGSLLVRRLLAEPDRPAQPAGNVSGSADANTLLPPTVGGR